MQCPKRIQQDLINSATFMQKTNLKKSQFWIQILVKVVVAWRDVGDNYQALRLVSSVAGLQRQAIF